MNELGCFAGNARERIPPVQALKENGAAAAFAAHGTQSLQRTRAIHGRGKEDQDMKKTIALLCLSFILPSTAFAGSTREDLQARIDSARQVLDQIQKDGVNTLVIVPLYPQVIGHLPADASFIQ